MVLKNKRTIHELTKVEKVLFEKPFIKIPAIVISLLILIFLLPVVFSEGGTAYYALSFVLIILLNI